MTYRARNRIDSSQVAIAVVIQEMVDATASGVLFTANPRTGKRDEMVIDATFGLGEALVSGQVIPETFVLGPNGGFDTLAELATQPTLTAGHLQELQQLGQQIADLYGEPMDIEWARIGDTIHILQARPITSLYPLPEPNPHPHNEPTVWFSFGAFQGMLDPITPLGQDMLRMTANAPARRIAGVTDWRDNQSIKIAGERLWIRVDGLLRIRATRTLMQRFMGMVEPGTAQIVHELAEEPGLQPTRSTPSPRIAAGIARLFFPALPQFGHANRNPARVHRALTEVADRFLERSGQFVEATGQKPTPQDRLNARLDAVEEVAATVLPIMLPAFAPIMATSIVQVARLRRAVTTTGLPDADALAMTVLRSLPGNVTTEMDLVLADLTAGVHDHHEAARRLADQPVDELARAHRDGTLPEPLQSAIDQFLASYGMRGVGEIDLGAPRWRDDPTPVIQNMKSYLQITDPHLQPRAIHRAGEAEAIRAMSTLAAAAPSKARMIRHTAKVIRGLFGARETPKFTIIRAFGLIRDALDQSAAELVAAGHLTNPADIYFLHVEELRHAFTRNWAATVRTRRATFDTEKRRGQVPRVIVSDGRTFFDGLGSDGDLHGMGVSAGVAKGKVRIVHDPREGTLQFGEILVCRGTDPAWTPLFLTAAGLITEVGGLMTHGSVVAREYGIPAVVGVHEATTRLTDGQVIRIDGSSGAIELVD